ncbi:MAG: hypothetical protein QM764_03315 [Chitinophagaceae bacterium]
MKKSIAIILVMSVCAASVHAQSLKDLLYSGKLKKDSNVVIRKGDDLSSKIDTSTKKTVEPEKIQSSASGATTEQSTPVNNTNTQSSSSSQNDAGTTTGNTAAPASATPTTNPVTTNSAPKDNNRIWKEYIDSVTSDVKKDILPNKKIKSDTYYLLVEYKIGVDGQTTISNVTCSPENSFLQQQVKERLTLTSPQLNPLVTNGKAREVTRKYNLTLTKP